MRKMPIRLMIGCPVCRTQPQLPPVDELTQWVWCSNCCAFRRWPSETMLFLYKLNYICDKADAILGSLKGINP